MQAPIIIYLIWRLTIYAYLFLLESVDGRFYWAWVRYWDSGHYIAIAQNGYHFPQQAFFPLWPLLIRVLSLSGISEFLSSFILSSLLSLIVFILFYLLAKRLIGGLKAKLSLILFCLFPSTMFLLTSYSEALFLTMAPLSFYLIEKKYYFWASFSAGFVSATRLAGIALAPSFLLSQKPLFQKLGLTLVSASGLITYMFYLNKLYGDPLYFIQAEKDWCESAGRCGVVFPLIPIKNFFELILMGKINIGLSPTFLDGFFATCFLLLTLQVLKKLGVNYFLYCIVIILLPLSSGSLVGMVRYVLAAFPIFFILPQVMKNKFLFFLLCLLLFLLQLRFIHLFINLKWVA